MPIQSKIIVTATVREDSYRIFTLTLSNDEEIHEYKICVFDRDLPIKTVDISQEKLDEFAVEQMKVWLTEAEGHLPKEKYRILMNGGKIVTDNLENFLSVQKKTSNLVRTNVTISAPLFEWAKAKAQKESTSFSDLVSRGLITLKDSDKEIDAWFKEQGAYFRKKLGDYGSFEVFHYLPNNYEEFDTDLLKNALQQAEIKRTGWPVGAYLTGGEQRPHPQQDGIRAEYNPSFHLLLDYWYAKNKGEFYFSRNLESDSGNGEAEPKKTLYFDTLIWRVGESLEHALAYYQALNVNEDERIKVKISLHGLSGRSLGAWNSMRAFSLRHYICSTDKVTWEAELSLQELKTQLDDTIYDSTKKLLVMFDFFVPNKEVVFDILNREYRKSNM